jgi:hypothetical protein
LEAKKKKKKKILFIHVNLDLLAPENDLVQPDRRRRIKCQNTAKVPVMARKLQSPPAPFFFIPPLTAPAG